MRDDRKQTFPPCPHHGPRNACLGCALDAERRAITDWLENQDDEGTGYAESFAAAIKQLAHRPNWVNVNAKIEGGRYDGAEFPIRVKGLPDA